MISIIIAAFNRFLLRHASPGYLLELKIKERQEQEFKALKLCIRLYLWEEKYGIQHVYTLEDIAQVFGRKIEEIWLLYDLLIDPQFLFIKEVLDYKHNMETLEKALSTKDVGLTLSI